MSSWRVHSSFTGTPTCLAIQAASAIGSLRRRRPKPPPMRVMCTVTSSSGMSSVRATSVRPGPGFCVGAQISILPFWKCAVQFCGSSGMCDRNG